MFEAGALEFDTEFHDRTPAPTGTRWFGLLSGGEGWPLPKGPPMGGEGSSDRVSDLSAYPNAAPAPPPMWIMLGRELGGYRSEAEIDLRRRFLMNQLYHPPNMAAKSTARPTPTPIPIFAPVDNPPPPPD